MADARPTAAREALDSRASRLARCSRGRVGCVAGPRHHWPALRDPPLVGSGARALGGSLIRVAQLRDVRVHFGLRLALRAESRRLPC